MKIEVNVEKMNEVVKEFFWLAWKASGKELGMGVFQAHPTATKEEVYENVVTAGDYCGGFNRPAGHLYADYVFGRMLKVGLIIIDPSSVLSTCTLEVKDVPPKKDYQGWSKVYSTYEDLLRAAIKEVGA